MTTPTGPPSPAARGRRRWFPVNDHPIDKASLLRRHRARRVRGRANGSCATPRRRAGRPGGGGARADGVVPRDHRHRRLGRPPGRTGLLATTRSTRRSPAACGRDRPSLAARARSSTCWPTPSALPVQHRRGDRRQPGRPVLRARDPDPPGVLEVFLARRRGQPGNGDASSCTSSRTSGSATTWPSRAGRTSGSTRASPPTPSGSGRSTRGAHAAGDLPGRTTRSPPTIRSGRSDRRPGGRPALRQRGLRARRDDLQALATGRRRAFWRIIRPGPEARRRQRHDRGVHPLAERVAGAARRPVRNSHST